MPCYIHPRGPIKEVFDHLWKDRIAFFFLSGTFSTYLKLTLAPFQFATGVAAHVFQLCYMAEWCRYLAWLRTESSIDFPVLILLTVFMLIHQVSK